MIDHNGLISHAQLVLESIQYFSKDFLDLVLNCFITEQISFVFNDDDNADDDDEYDDDGDDDMEEEEDDDDE